MLRTFLATGAVLVAGLWVLYDTTHGLRAFTQETARRVAIRDGPRRVPDIRLQLQDGTPASLAELQGQLVVATFMYTSCGSVCPLVGARMAEMRTQLQQGVSRDQVHFLSISFDPETDTPERLAGFAQRFRASRTSWWVARTQGELESVLRFFGVTVIPAGNGMYVHNAAFYLIDREQRLVDIIDENRPETVMAMLEDMQ